MPFEYEEEPTRELIKEVTKTYEAEIDSQGNTVNGYQYIVAKK